MYHSATPPVYQVSKIPTHEQVLTTHHGTRHMQGIVHSSRGKDASIKVMPRQSLHLGIQRDDVKRTHEPLHLLPQSLISCPAKFHLGHRRDGHIELRQSSPECLCFGLPLQAASLKIGADDPMYRDKRGASSRPLHPIQDLTVLVALPSASTLTAFAPVSTADRGVPGRSGREDAAMRCVWGIFFLTAKRSRVYFRVEPQEVRFGLHYRVS
jgi:hypothetical protein